jgi:hypothetical protein
MVSRNYVKCKTCGSPHTLRISVGHEPYQEHTFRCGTCNEEMIIGLKVDIKTVSINLEYISNCEPGDKEGLIVNLHPNYPIPENLMHTDQVFPWLSETIKIHEEQEKLLGGISGYRSLEEVRKIALIIKSISEWWQIIKKAWSLKLSGKNGLADIEFKKYKRPGFKGPYRSDHVIYHFAGTFLGVKRIKIAYEANEEAASIARSNPPEFERFKEYYLSKRQSEHHEGYFDIFSDYFKDFTEYNQVLAYSYYDLPLAKDASASSVAFKRTKMFYGNAYEMLTTNLAVLACINNIKAGRRFDQFEQMSALLPTEWVKVSPKLPRMLMS